MSISHASIIADPARPIPPAPGRSTDDAVRAGSARLLAAVADRPTSLAEHLERYGTVAAGRHLDLIGAVEQAGLTGRGGAAFPAARKLRAVRAAVGGPPVVVGNAAEGEPASYKDRTLLTHSPHLVLDGLQLAAEAVGASTAVLYVHPDQRLRSMLDQSLREREAAGVDEIPFRIVAAPDRFIAGEESAVVSVLDGGLPKPRTKPPMVFESGVGGRPTLVQNVETLAHMALIARSGPAWFRSAGLPAEPGTSLFTVSGAVRTPRVVEAQLGVPLQELLATAGGVSGPIQAVLFGGYHGSWLSWPEATTARMSNQDLRSRGAAVGAGVVIALPSDRCGLVETGRVLRYLASQTAGQCGPCANGLPRLAGDFDGVAGTARQGRSRRDIENDARLLVGRGACHHPDGTVGFVRSAMSVFQDEVARHARGECSATSSAPVLVTPDR